MCRCESRNEPDNAQFSVSSTRKIISILQNAIDSIAIGLEDFESTDNRRIVSSTRNIFAGILLLFKYKLCELSPEGTNEALIKQRVFPTIDTTGAVSWIGKGTKTVHVVILLPMNVKGVAIISPQKK